jgi:hypothetical protein
MRVLPSKVVVNKRRKLLLPGSMSPLMMLCSRSYIMASMNIRVSVENVNDELTIEKHEGLPLSCASPEKF